MSRSKFLLEAFTGTCERCGVRYKFTKSAVDKARFEAQKEGFTSSWGVVPIITISKTRELFFVRSRCGNVFVVKKGSVNEDAVESWKVADRYGLAKTEKPPKMRLGFVSVSMADFLAEVRATWGREDREALRVAALNQRIRLPNLEPGPASPSASPPSAGAEAAAPAPRPSGASG